MSDHPSTHCAICNAQLYWREKGDHCRACDPEAVRTGKVPYPQFCLAPKRCDGLSSCPRDWSCIE